MVAAYLATTTAPRLLISALSLAALLAGANLSAEEPLPAFPGATGAAKYALGGRGGDVYHVTNLDASGAGSLAHGVETADGPRTIVFDVGGTIHFENGFTIAEKERLTIAGQTAPGDGITIRIDDGSLRIQDSEHIIMQHLRLANGCADSRTDVLRTDGSKHVMLSHLTIRWGTRGNFVNRAGGAVTTQYTINAEPTDRQLGGWSGRMRQESGIFNYTLHKNLGIHQGGRFNMFQNGRFEFINNLTYNADLTHWQDYYIFGFVLHGTHHTPGRGPQLIDMNAINNVLIDGHNPPAYTFAFGRASRLYRDGNVRDWDPDEPFFPVNTDNDIAEGAGSETSQILNHAEGVEDEDDIKRINFAGFARVAAPLDLAMNENQHTDPVSARQAYINVLSRTGASAARDEHDHRYVRDVMNKTGALPQTLDDVPGPLFPELAPGERVVSTARDGIPDWWKEERGLDPEQAYHEEYNETGYTYLEEYLHSLAPHAFPPDPEDVEEIMIRPAQCDAASFGWPESEPSSEGLWSGAKDGVPHYILLRFDLSGIEPGTFSDALLQLEQIEASEEAAFRVYGLDHDQEGQDWDIQAFTDLPGLDIEAQTPSVDRDHWLLLGDIETNEEANGDTVILDNPNLAVFLNLAAYYRDEPDSDFVTLLIKPLNGAAAEFGADNESSPQLVLDAVAR